MSGWRLLDLLAQGVVRCPACGGALAPREDRAECAQCAARYRLANGALDLFGRYRDGAALPPTDRAFAGTIADALWFPKDEVVREAVARAVDDSRVVATEPHHAAEIRMLAERLNIAVPPAPESESVPANAGEANVDVRARLEVTHIEPVLPMQATILRSFRVRNTGTSPLSSTGPRALFLSYRWFDSFGQLVPGENRRSMLPVDIAPGGELTVIATIDTPHGEGAFLLRLELVGEGHGQAIERGALQLHLSRSPPTMLSVPNTGIDYGYGEDHYAGLALFEEEFARRGTQGASLIEIGGGIHPQSNVLAGKGHHVLSLDVSFPMSQLGALYFDHVDHAKREHMAFVACDAHHLPVRHGAFDAATIFSALHHFARPTLMLAELARAVRPGGIIGIFCEPCMPDPGASAYLRDLREGVNEQIWSIPEYGEIFRRAGLSLVAGRVDGGSLKVILQTPG
jgi:Methyltransferase domain